MRRRSRWTSVWILILALLGSCGSRSPVRVDAVPETRVREQLERSALTGDELSATTAWVLRLTELDDRFEEDPREVVRILHESVRQSPSRNGAFLIAELAYLSGRRLEDRDLFLTAAVYSYFYLLGEDGTARTNPWDRRFRWACDIYNRSIAEAFAGPDEEGKAMLLEPGRRELPVGFVDVEVDTSSFPFEAEGIRLLPADGFEVVGLSFRVRDSGLGAPLIAVAERRSDGSAGIGIRDETSVPATAFLRFEGGFDDLSDGLRAVLELHSTYDAGHVTVAGRRVPLEADLSTTIAYGTEAGELWKFNLRGLLHGERAAAQNGLILPRPYEPGRTPVVLVHGTASNPSKWAELYNSLYADTELRRRCQFWLFIYSTGSPIAYSAATLREKLTEFVAQHDPDGTDEALHRMVIIGHSQGGLLTKMTGTTLRADELLTDSLGLTLSELDLEEHQVELVRRLYDVEPLPFVDRLVFIATPHQGSFLADFWFARFLAKMINVPSELAKEAEDIFQRLPQERLPRGIEPRISTSLENMNPDSSFLKFLAAAPVDPRIQVHSIIPIGDAEEPAGADDGVVAYESAHLDDVASEALIPAKHSCQSHPRTIVEVRRILREHFGLETNWVEIEPPVE